MTTFKLKDPIKQIDGFEGYFISQSGRVYSNIQVNRAFFNGGMYEIFPKETNRGYLEIGLHWRDANGKRKRKWIRVHQLVAHHFCEKPADFDYKIYEPNHINGDKHDNRAENLEWVTRSDNQKHAINVLGKKIYVRPIVFDGVRYESFKEMGEKLGINTGSARAILSKGKSTYLGRELKYAEQ